MLAYTTASDLFYMPTALEAAVYIGGLLLVLAAPYLFLGLLDKRRAAQTQSKTSAETQTQL